MHSISQPAQTNTIKSRDSVVNGTRENDHIIGTSNAQVLRGKRGNDVLIGRGRQELLAGGPGDLGAGVHGPNEYVPIDEVIACAKVYAITALNWCGQEK